MVLYSRKYWESGQPQNGRPQFSQRLFEPAAAPATVSFPSAGFLISITDFHISAGGGTAQGRHTGTGKASSPTRDPRRAIRGPVVVRPGAGRSFNIQRVTYSLTESDFATRDAYGPSPFSIDTPGSFPRLLTVPEGTRVKVRPAQDRLHDSHIRIPLFSCGRSFLNQLPSGTTLSSRTQQCGLCYSSGGYTARIAVFGCLG